MSAHTPAADTDAAGSKAADADDEDDGSDGRGDIRRAGATPCRRCGGPLAVLGPAPGEMAKTRCENVRCRRCGAGGTLICRVDDWSIAKRVDPAVAPTLSASPPI